MPIKACKDGDKPGFSVLPEQEQRTCTCCGYVGPLEDFERDERYRDDRRNRCVRCKNDRDAERMRKMRARRSEIIAAAKAAPCADCGERFPTYVMDFDHRGDKEFGIAQAIGQNVSEERLLAEIAKCDVVCSNCHRERTFGADSEV